MAFLSQQEHVSDGTLQSVSFSIAFLDKAHLHFYIGNDEVTSTVPVAGVLVQEVTNYTVTLTSPVPNGSVFSVRRITPRTSVPHKFNNGAALFNAANTDENNTYTLFIVQEVYEQSGNGPFPNITTLDGTELLYVNVGGVRKQITVSNFLDQAPDVVFEGFKQDLANNTDPAYGAGMVGLPWSSNVYEEFNRGVVRPEWFGAIPNDNSAAYTSAVQSAITSACANKKELLLSGLYKTGSLSFPSNTNGCTIRGSNRYCGFNFSDTSGTLLSSLSTYGIVLDTLTIIGQGSSNPTHKTAQL